MKPKKRHTKSRSRKRRAVIFKKPIVLSSCPKCKRPVKPHTACAFCGTYKGHDAIKIRIKKGSKEDKKRKEEEKQDKKTKKTKK